MAVVRSGADKSFLSSSVLKEGYTFLRAGADLNAMGISGLQEHIDSSTRKERNFLMVDSTLFMLALRLPETDTRKSATIRRSMECRSSIPCPWR